MRFNSGASLVAQWLAIRLPMQGTRVLSPGPGRSHMPREYLSPCATTTEARAPTAHALQLEKPPQWEARTPQ